MAALKLKLRSCHDCRYQSTLDNEDDDEARIKAINLQTFFPISLRWRKKKSSFRENLRSISPAAALLVRVMMKMGEKRIYAQHKIVMATRRVPRGGWIYGGRSEKKRAYSACERWSGLLMFFSFAFWVWLRGWAHGVFAYMRTLEATFPTTSVEQIRRKKNMSCSIVHDEEEEKKKILREKFFFPLSWGELRELVHAPQTHTLSHHPIEGWINFSFVVLILPARPFSDPHHHHRPARAKTENSERFPNRGIHSHTTAHDSKSLAVWVSERASTSNTFRGTTPINEDGGELSIKVCLLLRRYLFCCSNPKNNCAWGEIMMIIWRNGGTTTTLAHCRKLFMPLSSSTATTHPSLFLSAELKAELNSSEWKASVVSCFVRIFKAKVVLCSDEEIKDL